MKTSLQAANGRHLADTDPNFPWRLIVWFQHTDGEWKMDSVSEHVTEHMALNNAKQEYAFMRRDEVAMHYVIGKIAA